MREDILFSSSDRAVDRGPIIQRLQVRTLWEDNFFALLVLSSRRSGGSPLGFRAGSHYATNTQND